MPTRLIYESVNTSESLAAVTAEAERLFWRLVTLADDFGRFEARPSVIRGRAFPLLLDRINDSDIALWLAELVRSGMVICYTVDGKSYLRFANWSKFQRVRAQKSKYPDPLPDAATIPIVRTSARIRTHPHASATSTKSLTNAKSLTESSTNTKSSSSGESLRGGAPDDDSDDDDDDSEVDVLWVAGEFPKIMRGHPMTVSQTAELRERLVRIAPRERRAWCEAALKRTADFGGKSWAYMRQVLDDALSSGRAPGTNGGNGKGFDARSATAEDLQRRYGHDVLDTPEARREYYVPAGYEELVQH